MSTNEYLEKGLAIVARLNHATYEAYLVGGVVRDYFLDNPFIDIDITTSATPQDIQELYPNIDMTYSEYGTTLLTEGRYRFEITTFRNEEYTVSRHPSKVHFSKNLTVDIMRRDFTINALAMTENQKVIDLVGGIKDIKQRKIKMVGNNKNKFREDPLRILRGFELLARFNFRFEKKTLKLMMASASELTKLSSHHLAYGLNKIFDALYGDKALKQLVELGFANYMIGYQEGLKVIVQHYKKINTFEKFALCYALCSQIPKDTHFEKLALQRFKHIRSLYQELTTTKLTPLILFNNDLENVIVVNKIKRLLNQKERLSPEKVKQMYNNLPIKHIDQLAIKGEDLAKLLNGQDLYLIKEIMQDILVNVLNKKLPNDYYTLKAYSEKKIAAHNKTRVSPIIQTPVNNEIKYNIPYDGLSQNEEKKEKEEIATSIDVIPEKKLSRGVADVLKHIEVDLEGIIDGQEKR